MHSLCKIIKYVNLTSMQICVHILLTVKLYGYQRIVGIFLKKKFSVHAHIHVYVEARGGGVSCFITLHLIPLRQGLSLE